MPRPYRTIAARNITQAAPDTTFNATTRVALNERENRFNVRVTPVGLASSCTLRIGVETTLGTAETNSVAVDFSSLMDSAGGFSLDADVVIPMEESGHVAVSAVDAGSVNLEIYVGVDTVQVV
jgi:hypothetical protein